MSLRSRDSVGSLALLMVLFSGAFLDCGPSHGARRAIPDNDAAEEPEGGTGGGESGRGGSTFGGSGGTSGSGGSSEGLGGNSGGGGSGGSSGGSGGVDASVPRDMGAPDVAVPRDMAPPDTMAPPRDTAPPPPPPDTAPPASSLTDGLVSRWKLDGNTADAMETGNNGTLTGGTSWLSAGFPGAKYPNTGSLRFDGSSGIMDITVKGMPGVNEPMSVSVWANYDAVPTTTQPFIGLGDSRTSGGSRIKVGFKGGQFAAWKGNGTVLTDGQAPASGWHHMVYTFDGTTRHIYVDGVDDGPVMMDGDSGTITQGHVGSFGTEHFNGALDELRVYRRALTASEVTALHEGRE